MAQPEISNNIPENNGHQTVDTLPESSAALIFEAIDQAFNAEDPLAQISALRQQKNPEIKGDIDAIYQETLDALEAFSQGIICIKTANSESGQKYFQAAAEKFDSVGLYPLRDRSIGYRLYSTVIIETGKGNVNLARDIFSELDDYLGKSDQFQAQDKAFIDHLAPENLFLQGFESLRLLNFDQASILMEEASNASEKVARKYYKEGSPLHNQFMGMARFYSATYTYHKAVNDFNYFEYSSLAQHNHLANGAIEASVFLRKGDKAPIVENQIYLSDAYTEILEVTYRLASIMEKALTTNIKPEPRVYQELKRKIQVASDLYKRLGKQGLPLIINCKYQLDRVENLENLLRSVSKEQVALDSYQKFQEEALRSLTEPLNNLAQWSKLALAFSGLSALFILVGAATAIFGNTQVGILTSVSSLLSSFVSFFIHSQLQVARKDVRDSKVDLLGQMERSGSIFFNSDN